MNRSSIILAVLLAFIGIPEFAYAQQTGSPTAFPMVVSSDFSGPYDVIRPVFGVLPLTAGFLTASPVASANEVIPQGLKALDEFARKNGGDAVINTSVQIVMYPGVRSSGEQGLVLLFGTVVKLRTEKK